MLTILINGTEISCNHWTRLSALKNTIEFVAAYRPAPALLAVILYNLRVSPFS